MSNNISTISTIVKYKNNTDSSVKPTFLYKITYKFYINQYFVNILGFN